MKNVYSFSQFLNEKKDVKKDVKKEIEKDAKKIATEMFDRTGNLHFEYSKDGMPKSIIFNVTKKDFDLDYDQLLSIDYSENVLKKREYKVELKFNNKNVEKNGNKEKLVMKFDIKLTKSSDVKFNDDDYYLVWEFDEKPIKVIKSIKSQNQKYIWDNPELKILKSVWDNLATSEVLELIDDAEGIKKRNQ